MPVSAINSRVTLTHENGSSAEVLLYGATVISWRAPSPHGGPPTERLFTSATAALDGSKPVRGGIPLVFPFFGPPTLPEHTGIPQHGFARNSWWIKDSTLRDESAGVSVRFVLPPRKPYPALEYVVTLAAHELTSALYITAPASAPNPLVFQALFHTYIRAAAPLTSVAPLKDILYRDKVQQGHPEVREVRERVDVRAPTDSVYAAAGGSYDVNTGENTGVVHVRASGLDDVVVWNPGQVGGQKIADLEEGGWNKFICVEPGAASYWITLAPGETWTGQQALTIS